MDKKKIPSLKGFKDYLPPEAAGRMWLKSKIVPILQSWGYEPLETPTLEPLELFTGEIGEDEKLFYRFKDLGNRDVMLRYDQTLPTCRVVAQNMGQLVFPWRRYQIQSNFRAEKPQAGRYREFTQIDYDIFGIESRTADAEVIALTLEIYKQIGFKNAVALINSRELMKDVPYPAIVSIDKLEKIGKEGVIADMLKKGITDSDADKYFDYVQNLKPNDEIKIIFDYLQNSGIPSKAYKFQPTLARSFSYSEGPIWEIIIPEYPSGSVAGGERYDGIFSKLIGKPFPATGIAIGLDRTVEAATSQGLIPDYTSKTQILVTIFSEDLSTKSLQLGTQLRQAGIAVEVYPDFRTKLEKQLKYASRKNIPYVAILGPDEFSDNQIIIKDLCQSKQTKCSVTKAINILKTS